MKHYVICANERDSFAFRKPLGDQSPNPITEVLVKKLIIPFVFLLSADFSYAQSDMQVPDITVLGTNAKAHEAVPTVSELSGTRLQRKKRSTVGETLANETGVTSSFFGPNASRPVIRGLEGDRIRVLQNGTGVLDASSASQDHAVATDTLNVERIEIVRGPAALLYGPNAVGGVVNLVTTRIPEKQPDGLRGKIESRYSSVDDGRSGALAADAAAGKHWAVHADASQRAADDYHVPGYARTAEVRAAEPATENEAKGRAYNSFNRTGEFSAGTSYIFENGFVGGSFTSYESTYGTVAERFVHINMLQQRYDLAAEVRNLGWIESIRAKNTYSHYKHDEMEGGERGTTFKNDGDEFRVEAKHRPVAGYGGRIGLQGNVFDFAAKGDESFLPSTSNQNYSVFVFEEKLAGRFKPSFGLRGDQSEVRSKSDVNFGAGSAESFSGGSASLGFHYQLNEPNALVLNLAYTERAPNYEELFSNGPHVATKIFETGDRNLKKEQSQSAEFSLRHKSDDGQGSAGVFVQDFNNFIALSPTGNTDTGSNLPIYNYLAVDARLYGAEFEYRHKLPQILPGGRLEVEGKLDFVRGINRNTGDNLPRITPLRETLSLIYKANRFQADVEWQRSERQKHTAPFETKTAEYNMLNAGVEMPVSFSSLNLSVFARALNILNEEARNHVSVIKDLAPLPGRGYSAGIQATF